MGQSWPSPYNVKARVPARVWNARFSQRLHCNFLDIFFISLFLRETSCETFLLSSASGDQEREEARQKGLSRLGLGFTVFVYTAMDSPEATRTKSSAQSPPLQVTPFPPIPTPETATTTATIAAPSSKSPPVQVICLSPCLPSVLVYITFRCIMRSIPCSLWLSPQLIQNAVSVSFSLLFIESDGHFRRFLEFLVNAVKFCAIEVRV